MITWKADVVYVTCIKSAAITAVTNPTAVRVVLVFGPRYAPRGEAATNAEPSDQNRNGGFITEQVKFWLRVNCNGHQALEVPDHSKTVEESPELFGLDGNDLDTIATIFPDVHDRRRVILETAFESGWIAISGICRCRVGYFSFAFTSDTVPEVRLLRAIQWFGRRHSLQHTDIVIIRNAAPCVPNYKRWLYGDLGALAANLSEGISPDIGGGN